MTATQTSHKPEGSPEKGLMVVTATLYEMQLASPSDMRVTRYNPSAPPNH